jgi:hypothetical protein
MEDVRNTLYGVGESMGRAHQGGVLIRMGSRSSRRERNKLPMITIQPPSLTGNLNRGFTQPHSHRTNQHNMESMDQEHQLGANEAAVYTTSERRCNRRGG